jgi:hypothetical protein
MKSVSSGEGSGALAHGPWNYPRGDTCQLVQIRLESPHVGTVTMVTIV